MQYKIDPNKIVYEDKIFLIYDKPRELPTQGTAKGNINLYDLLIDHQKAKRAPYLALHHRLDAATSGLILFCKNKNFNKYIAELFQKNQIEKKYLCISNNTNNAIQNPNWINEESLTPFKFKHFKKCKVSKSGQTAKTHFYILDQNENYCLIKAMPKTGRLHQIRVHLAHDQLPIIGDFHYNQLKSKLPLMLHAFELEFIHPQTKNLLKVQSSIPEHMLEFMKDNNLSIKEPNEINPNHSS